MPLTEEQRRALVERAHLPEARIPQDITARVEIAPALSIPFPLLDDDILKKRERVPLFYYSLRSENSTPSSPADTKVIFYIHGGAYLFCHPTDVPYVDWCAAILRALAAEDKGPCILIAPCYRLATVPENAFPAAVQDILAAYDFVIGQGYNPSNITITGDNAGGGHDYDKFSEYAKAQAGADLLLLPFYKIASTAYIGGSGLAPADPLISGSLVPFTELWPKMLIMVGGADQLIDGSREPAKRLTALKRPVELIEYDERPHSWWMHPDIFPEEVRDATRRIARFVFD